MGGSKHQVRFPETSICNNELRDELTPIIDIEEVSLFDEYV